MSSKITTEHLRRQAIVYVRQSTMDQVINNLESQRRQYALADGARSLGWNDITVIDDDLDRSGSGAHRPDNPRSSRAHSQYSTSFSSNETGSTGCRRYPRYRNQAVPMSTNRRRVQRRLIFLPQACSLAFQPCAAARNCSSMLRNPEQPLSLRAT
jgi:hypothetical protein